MFFLQCLFRNLLLICNRVVFCLIFMSKVFVCFFQDSLLSSQIPKIFAELVLLITVFPMFISKVSVVFLLLK